MNMSRSVTALTGAVALAAGLVAGVSSPAAAASAPGVYLWGNNNAGQLDDGTQTDRNTPTAAPGLPAGVRQVSMGVSWGMALLADGTVVSWGQNVFGQLGNNSTGDRPTPGPVIGLSGVTQISAGDFNALALKSDGTVWAWGSDVDGELGQGAAHTFGPLARPVPGLTGMVQVAAGHFDSMALRNDGTVWAWGANNHYQLGNNGTQASAVPGTVPFLGGVSQIANGGSHGLALAGANGNVYGWGQNDHGEVGVGATADVHLATAVPNTIGVTQIAAGGSHSLAVMGTDHALLAWGDNSRGGFGDGTTTSFTLPHRTGFTGIAHIAAGGADDSMAIRTDGSVWTFGDNSHGQLGTGSTAPLSVTPQQVPTLVAASSPSSGAASDAVIAQSTVAPVPNVNGDDIDTAITELNNAGFAVNLRSFVDNNCTSIDRVNSQIPAAGTLAPLGSTVTIWVGDPPPNPCP